jgi:5,10-methylenetetrahydrofolate reductase
VEVTARSFKEALSSGDFLVTAEIGPPKGTNLEEMRRNVELLKDKVDALNVTDNQSSVMRFPSLGGCLLIKELGGEPILQMTCRDRNRLALQADLLFAYSRGIRNVLCLTGDFITVGDHKEAKAVFDLDSVQLLRTVRTLEEGKDLAGNELDGKVEFCAGAVVTPEAEPLEPQLIKFEKKVEAGAEFFQTQAVYDPEKFAEFMELVKPYNVPILAGIIPLRSAGMARFMNRNVPGIRVPEGLIEELDGVKGEERVKKSIEIAARLINQIKDLCQGVHIMAIGWEEIVPHILEASGLNRS